MLFQVSLNFSRWFVGVEKRHEKVRISPIAESVSRHQEILSHRWCSRIYTTSSTPNSVKRSSICCGGKIVRCNVLDARATTLAAGARTNIDLDANAIGAIGASVLNDLTNTLLHPSQRPLAYWLLATLLLCFACSSRRSARAVVSIQTRRAATGR